MKKIILLIGVLISIAAAHVAFGQEGIIYFETKINMHRNLPPEREGMKNMIPEFRTTKEQLIFNANESLYKSVEEEEEEEATDGGGMRMVFRTPKNETYVNQSETKRISLQEFMGKNYLISDTLKVLPWKFTGETKTIQGYVCKSATYFNEERKQNITAWFTDKLRPFLGPEGFHSLPGAVLMVDINDGERTITASKIELRALKKNELKVPAQGIKTTQAEFRKMVQEQMEKIRANGGNIIIR